MLSLLPKRSLQDTVEVVVEYLCVCMYDLQKAFDSIEYPVLLNRLYDLGVHGKCWRIGMKMHHVK